MGLFNAIKSLLKPEKTRLVWHQLRQRSTNFSTFDRDYQKQHRSMSIRRRQLKNLPMSLDPTMDKKNKLIMR